MSQMGMCSVCKGKTSLPRGCLFSVGIEWVKHSFAVRLGKQSDLAWHRPPYARDQKSEDKKGRIIDLGEHSIATS